MSFNPGSMISAGGTIHAGVEAKNEAERQAKIQRMETQKAIKDKLREAERFRSRQEFEYLESGVMLEGSPLMVLKQTTDEARMEARDIERIGEAKESSLRKKGKAAFTSSIFQSIGQMFGGR